MTTTRTMRMMMSKCSFRERIVCLGSVECEQKDLNPALSSRDDDEEEEELEETPVKVIVL